MIADLDSQKEDRDGQMEKKALLQRYTQQLNEQEKSAQLEAKKDSAQAALDKMIEELAFDVKLT